MHSRYRSSGFPSSRTPSPSYRNPSKARSDFTSRPPNWIAPGRDTDQPAGYGGSSYGVRNEGRTPFDDRGDRDKEKLASEATRLAAEYFASKDDKYSSRGGRFDESMTKNYNLPYMDAGPHREGRGVRDTQFSRASHEEFSFSQSNPKYDSKYDRKPSSYRDPARAPFDEPRYPRGGHAESRKYDNFGDRGDFIGTASYESSFPRDALGDSFTRKYDGDYRAPIGESGHSSYYAGAYDPYASSKDLKGRGRDRDGGYRDRDRGRDRDRYRDRDDAWDRERRSFDPFSSDRKNGSGGGYDRSRRDDVISTKRKSRPFDASYSGDALDRNSFPVGNELFAKEPSSKDLFLETNRPPQYLNLLDADSSRRRQESDHDMNAYDYPGSMDEISRRNSGNRSPPLPSDRADFREPRELLERPFPQDVSGGRDNFRRELELEPAPSSSLGERDEPLLGPRAGSFDVKEKSRFSSYSKEQARYVDNEPRLRSSSFEKGRSPALDDRSRSR